MMNKLDIYINKFKETNPQYQNKKIYSYAFGDGEHMANELAELVFNGEKCGTTSLYELYELDNERIPEVDEISVILDGEGNPKCIIKNTETEVLKFKDITEKHAFTEGEGDKSLEYWRNVHIDFFTNSCKETNEIDFNEDSLVLFETFEVIYK